MTTHATTVAAIAAVSSREAARLSPSMRATTPTMNWPVARPKIEPALRASLTRTPWHSSLDLDPAGNHDRGSSRPPTTRSRRSIPALPRPRPTHRRGSQRRHRREPSLNAAATTPTTAASFLGITPAHSYASGGTPMFDAQPHVLRARRLVDATDGGVLLEQRRDATLVCVKPGNCSGRPSRLTVTGSR